MPVNNKSNNPKHSEAEETISQVETTTGQEKKPHIIRRNIEDHLAERALKRRLTDIFDDDFLLD